jgi:acyl transferase domain-containing protein
MSAKQRLGLDEEPSQATAAQEPTQSGKQSPVAGPQRWAGHLAAQYRHLVTEHDQFDRQFFVVTPEEPEQLEHSDER